MTEQYKIDNTNLEINAETTEAGQAVYSKLVLSIYDWWVLGFSNKLLWKCPTRILENEFKKYASDNHCDVGVGTGYYPDKCLSNPEQRLGLIDLNANSLQIAAERNKRFNPETYQANILEPISIDCKKFDSLSLHYVLHCLPGSLHQKATCFQHLKPLLNPEATVFGSTILGTGVERNALANYVSNTYNRKGIFCNSEDSLEILTTVLSEHFSSYEVRQEGSVLIFHGQLS
ncbi:MAG: class I SAM-dependent methyltransferase [Cellvibrionaceae bacterium]